jgi:phage baseplate assembly protein W
VAAAPAQDLGTDVDARSGVPLRWSLVSGRANLANALARRFITARGSLPDDPEYGADLRDYLSSGLTPAGLSQLRGTIVAQAAAEKRIQSVDSVDFAFNQSSSALAVALGLSDAQGPFDLILAITAVTVDILNRGQAAPALLAAVAAAIPTGGAGGAAGAPGPAGAPGTSGPAGPAGAGGGGVELTFPETVASSSGAEEVIAQVTVDFNGLSGGTLTFDLAGQGLSAAGTATFRLYVAGTYGAADGTLLGSVTTASASYVQVQISTTSANPTGLKPVKITAQSSGAAVDARLRDFTVSIR